MNNSHVEVRNLGGRWAVLKDGELQFLGDEYNAASVATAISDSNRVEIAIFSPLALLPFLSFPDSTIRRVHSGDGEY